MSNNVWGPAPGLTRMIAGACAIAMAAAALVFAHGLRRQRAVEIVAGAIVLVVGGIGLFTALVG